LGAIVLVLFFWAGFYWATHPIPTTEEYYQQIYGAREAWVKAVREREARQQTQRVNRPDETATAELQFRQKTFRIRSFPTRAMPPG
ncbi:MAG: hypothetical protein GXP27_14340, partial [Planctomycetes bacterium]|nr:hypothetical protein [Planctomycetota bacterium]